MNEIVLACRLDLLKLSNADADAELAMERRGGRIGVDALGIPAVIGKDAHGFFEPASHIKEAAAVISGQRREQAERARCPRTADRATVCPGGVFGVGGEPGVAAGRARYLPRQQ